MCRNEFHDNVILTEFKNAEILQRGVKVTDVECKKKKPWKL